MTDVRDIVAPQLPKADGPLVVTQSDIRAFKTCRRAWLLGTYYGLSLKMAPMFGPAHLGTRIHMSLYYFYADNADLLLAYDALVQRDRKLLEESGIMYGLDVFEKEANLGLTMLSGYLEWLEDTGADSDIKVIGAEQRLSYLMPTSLGPVELRGKVDLRAQRISDNARFVLDHKTTQHFSNITTTAHKNEQLQTYLMLERLNFPDDPDSWLHGGVFGLIRRVARTERSKPPYYDRIEVSHNETELRNFWVRTQGTLEDYYAAVKRIETVKNLSSVAYPTAGTQCRYCPFKAVCDMMDDGSRAEDMIAAVYTPNDPHARYNEELAGELIVEVAAN